jgi:hypothetical protein
VIDLDRGEMESQCIVVHSKMAEQQALSIPQHVDKQSMITARLKSPIIISGGMMG